LEMLLAPLARYNFQPKQNRNSENNNRTIAIIIDVPFGTLIVSTPELQP
jgi:hypothetical protein